MDLYDQANPSASFSPVDDNDALICVWKDRWLPTRDYGEGTELITDDTELSASFTDPTDGCTDGISSAPPSGSGGGNSGDSGGEDDDGSGAGEGSGGGSGSDGSGGSGGDDDDDGTDDGSGGSGGDGGEDTGGEPPGEEASGCSPGTEVVVADPELVGNWTHITDHRARGFPRTLKCIGRTKQGKTTRRPSRPKSQSLASTSVSLSWTR